MQIFNRIVINECNDEWVMNMKIAKRIRLITDLINKEFGV